MSKPQSSSACLVTVIWIDWYTYHVARFRGLESNAILNGQCTGIELVGGIGVHAGLKFREGLPDSLDIDTLLPNSSWSDANHWKLAFMLWRRLSALRPEVVLIPGYYTIPALSAALWARLHRRVSVLMTESTAGDHRRLVWKESLKGFGIRLLFQWAVAGGQAHIDYLLQLGFAANRIVKSYDVVDNAFFRDGTNALREEHASRVEDGSRPSGPFFLYVGRLAEEKNVVTLLRAWLVYRGEGGGWPLVLVGDGPSSAELKALAARSPFASDIIFPGLKSSRDLLPYYASAGCFVLPSIREPWGLVVNEALASELPVLASSRCGCVTELLEAGGNGFTFEATDIAGLAVLLLRMAALSPLERAAMGAISASIIRRYTPEHFGASISAIVSQTLSRKAVQLIRGDAR